MIESLDEGKKIEAQPEDVNIELLLQSLGKDEPPKEPEKEPAQNLPKKPTKEEEEELDENLEPSERGGSLVRII
jgi:hypothetical protein